MPADDSSGRPGSGRSPVMADVAALAGVSHQTVSRVLNGHPSVRPATRERVERAIRDLRYRPNSAARTLVTRRSRVIGVVSAATSHHGPSQTLLGLQAAARAAGYAVSVALLPEASGTAMGEAVEQLRGQSVDGIVVLAPDDAAIEAVREVGAAVPMVVVRPGERHGVWVDQEDGARQATRHLLSLGHAVVHHVAGPADWPEARARRAGWEAELRAVGVAVPDPEEGRWTPASGFAAGARLARRPGVSAVFVGNDQMAVGVLRALAEAGRAVPGDVSVVGFDDVPEAAFLFPPLTTVRQDFSELGRHCLQALLGELAGAAPDGRPVVPELVVRASTAPPGGGSPRPGR